MREKISALLDEELEQHEWDSALGEIGRDSDLEQTWQRYHLIRAAFRKESIYHQSDLAQKVANRIADEPEAGEPAMEPAVGREQETVVPLKRRQQRWLPALAMAASVAAVAVLGFSYWQPGSPTAGTELAANTSFIVNERATKWDVESPELENTLNGFLVEHGEFTALSGMNGLITYAKFVSYDSSE